MQTPEELEEIDDAAVEEELVSKLLDEVEAGDATAEFLGSPVGKSLVRRAKNDYLGALIQLSDADLQNNLAEAMSLQMKARVAKQTLCYIADNLKARDQALALAEEQYGKR